MPTLREVREDFQRNEESVRRSTTEWLKTRPESVQKLAERIPAWKLYQLPGCSEPTCEEHAYLRDAVVALFSYFEDGATVSVRVLHCPREPERGVERFVCPVGLLRPVRITEDDEVVREVEADVPEVPA